MTSREILIAAIAALAGYLFGRSRKAKLVSRPVTAAPDAVTETGEWMVVLQDAGVQKINVIKALRSFSRLGLKEAKDLAEAQLPVPVAQGMSEAAARRAVAELKTAGAVATIAHVSERRGGAA